MICFIILIFVICATPLINLWVTKGEPFDVEYGMGLLTPFALSQQTLIGIVAGITVFLGTLAIVFVLLYHGGSLDRLKLENKGLPDSERDEKPMLYDHVLQKRSVLNCKLPLKSLHGNGLNMLPYDCLSDTKQKHALKNLFQSCRHSESMSRHHTMWHYLPFGPFDEFPDFENFYTTLSKKHDSNLYFVERKNEFVGVLYVDNNDPSNLVCDIGHLWFIPEFCRVGASTAVMFLILDKIFALGYRRVSWKCDAHDTIARKAAHSIGFVLEGVMRKRKIVKNRNTDLAFFSILNSEWLMVKSHLSEKLTRKSLP